MYYREYEQQSPKVTLMEHRAAGEAMCASGASIVVYREFAFGYGTDLVRPAMNYSLRTDLISCTAVG